MASQATTRAERLTVGILTRVATLNPREARDQLSSMVAAQVYETPYRPPSGDGPAQPLLFDGPLACRTRDGVTTCEGRVRLGVTFSDGTPLTPELAARSLGRVEAVRAQAEVSTTGDLVVFRLKAPNPRFELALTLLHCGLVLEKGGHLLGTGPYVFTPDTGSDEIRLARNPRYRSRTPIEEIAFRVYPPDDDGRPSALIAALESGEVDFSNMLSRTDAQGVSNVRRAFSPAAATAILYFNMDRVGLDSPVVRKAMALAVDRLAVAQISYSNPLAFAATSILPSIMGMAHDGLIHDLPKARALLATPGIVKPQRLRLLPVWAPRPYLPNPRPVAELIVRQLGELEIAVEIVPPGDADQFFAKLERADYDMVLGGWIADTPDPADFLEAQLHSERTHLGPASFNLSRYRSPRMDAALAAFRSKPGPEARNAILEILNEDVPLMPLMYGPNVVVHASRVRNAVVSPLGIPHFEQFELAR